MQNPDDQYYTENHEWVRVEDEVAYVGITVYAQRELGSIVYVELPEPDTVVEKGEEVLSVESVIASSPVYAPLSGRIVEVNEELEDNPNLLNEAAYENHIYVVEIQNREELDSLLGVEEYENFLKEA